MISLHVLLNLSMAHLFVIHIVFCNGLKNKYPDEASSFSGNSDDISTNISNILQLGEHYSHLIGLGVGGSKAQWSIWFDFFSPEHNRD